MARGLILAARHPRPRISARVCYGRTDVELAEPAEKGAETLLLAARDPVERIVCSPATRARSVALAVRALTGAPLHEDDRLVEMDFGAWEGRAWSAIPRAEIDAWAADPLRFRPGGGENVQAVLARVRRAWTGIASSADTTLVVTHAGPIRCLLHLVRGMPLLDAIAVSIGYGAVERFEPPGYVPFEPGETES